MFPRCVVSTAWSMVKTTQPCGGRETVLVPRPPAASERGGACVRSGARVIASVRLARQSRPSGAGGPRRGLLLPGYARSPEGRRDATAGHAASTWLDNAHCFPLFSFPPPTFQSMSVPPCRPYFLRASFSLFVSRLAPSSVELFPQGPTGSSGFRVASPGRSAVSLRWGARRASHRADRPHLFADARVGAAAPPPSWEPLVARLHDRPLSRVSLRLACSVGVETPSIHETSICRSGFVQRPAESDCASPRSRRSEAASRGSRCPGVDRRLHSGGRGR